MSQAAPIARATEQASNAGVLAKLLIFAVAMAVVPITAYYGSLTYLWNGNASYAALTAVLAANIVLVAYIVVASLEDQPSKPTAPSSQHVSDETKKER